jgi:hypothetical protein
MYKILLLMALPFFMKGQNSPTENFMISPQGHVGYIISQHNTMGHLIKSHIYGAELNYVFRTDGSKPWQQIHNYPEIGVCIVHIYLGNSQQLGNLEALYPYLNIRLNKLSKKVALNLRMGAGLAYISKPFNRITNHQNNVIGTHLNGFVNLRLNTTFVLTKSWRLIAGLGLSHASDGATKLPNLGLNMPTINLGVAYAFGNKVLQLKKDSIAPAIKKWDASIVAVAGVKEINPDGAEYMAYGLQLNIYKTLNHKNKIGGGIETSYDNAIKKYLSDDSVNTTKPGDIIKGGVKFCYAFTIGRLSLPVDFGIYFYKRLPSDDLFFHRIGARYMITKHLIANVTLLTHWARADYFEWGMGYQF